MTLYTTPSGLGGIFTVRIIEELEGDCVRCKIHMPRNPDFHGHEFIDHRDSLTPQ